MWPVGPPRDRDDRQHDGGVEQRRVGRREVVGDEDVGFGPVGQAGQRQAEADRDRAVAHVVDVGDALGEVAAGAGELVAERLDRLGQRARTSETSAEPAGTADGHRVAILANLGNPDRAAAARAAGAEGVGLLRTEFCFEGRGRAPTVAEQVAAYGQVAQAFAGTRVVIRLLDAGADKPLPYVRSAAEDNPALGVRGLRALRAADDVLAAQLAAIAAVSGAGDAEIWAMAPMVATADEARWFADTARGAGIATAGVMIEIPAAALAATERAGPGGLAPASGRTTWRR